MPDTVCSLVVRDLPFTLDQKALQRQLHCGEDDEPFRRALELYEAAAPRIHPGLVLARFPVEEATQSGVRVGGRFFQSRVIAKKLREEPEVLLFLATCGRELGEYIAACADPLDSYLLDQIAYLAYQCASEQVSALAEREFGIARHVRLCPGSIIDWSVGDVLGIFALLDGLHQQLGVRVLSSGLIDPLKSTSGLLYETQEEFESCAICPRAGCENRKLPFDEDLQQAMLNR